MLAIRPNEELPVTVFIGDHTDTSTYFVRSVVKNARTLATLATLDLTDNGDRSFSYNWRTPADAVGLGIYIKITSTIYTDSGYTTKSSYPEQTDLYKIELEKANFGGGGADIDYKKIRKIVAEVVAEEVTKLPPFPEIPKPEKISLVPLLTNLGTLQDLIRDLPNKFPLAKEFDVRPILTAIANARAEIINSKDFSTLVFRLESLEKTIQDADPEKAKQAILDVVEEFRKLNKFTDADIKQVLKQMEVFNKIPFLVLQKNEEPTPKVLTPFSKYAKGR